VAKTSSCTTPGYPAVGFRSLEEGTKVSYEATQGKKGMQAENVTPA
jgi:CspA family cold shock protein